MKLIQGNKSQVSLELVDGLPCVRKRYNDNGDPRKKCLRELAFYRWYAGLSAIPKLVAHDCPIAITLERLEGMPLSVCHQALTQMQLNALSHAHGHHMGQFLRHEPSSAVEAAARQNFPGSHDIETLVAHMVDVIGKHLDANPEFQREEIRHAVESTQRVLALDRFWGEPTLCKLDWNASNVLVNNGTISGYIDFEQAFFGNRIVFIGTIIDHINVLSWTHVRRGIEAACGALPSVEIQKAAANFSMCYKLVGCCHDGKITFFTPERLVTKFSAMNRGIEATHCTAGND